MNNISTAELFPLVCMSGRTRDLSVFTELLHHLPVDLGVAFVVINNSKAGAAPLFDSITACTRMPVEAIAERLPVRPNRVFFLQPGWDLAVLDREFRLQSASKRTGWSNVITLFLQSLTLQWKGPLVAVILSGLDGDGSGALAGIKQMGGITIVQTVDTAEEQDMPISAIHTGCVDFILPVKDIAREIVRIARDVNVEV